MCVRELEFVIRIQIWNRSSEARIRSKNVIGALEELARPKAKQRRQRVDHVWHTARLPLCPCVPHMVLTWHMLISRFLSLSLSLSFKNIFLPSKHNLKKIEKKENVQKILHDFCHLDSIITFSFQLRITWFKNQKCWSWWELQTPSIWRAKWLHDF